MNRSTFRMIKYRNGSLFSKARYMNGVGFEILARTPVPKFPPKLPPDGNSHESQRPGAPWEEEMKPSNDDTNAQLP